jgi:hypothetical protein
MIESIKDLVDALEQKYDGGPIDNFINIINLYIGTDWKEYIQETKLDFYKVKIYLSKNFEIILIIWKEGYSTPLHKHPKNGCVLKILEGYLVEEIINDDKKQINNFITGNISYMHDNKGLHKISSLKNSYSLHIYSPPGFYDK